MTYRTYLPPWDTTSPARYPMAALERHVRACIELDMPDNTPPATVRALMAALDDDTRLSILAKCDEAVERLAFYFAWHPEDYDPANLRRVKTDIMEGAGRYRHMAFWGGRGGSKSHDVAEAVVELASIGQERVVVGREFLESIKDSSHSLFVNKIKASQWVDQWQITERELRNKTTGSVISFMGLNRNPDSARGLEGCTIFVGEEAEAFTQHSMDILLPTMRSKGSRLIWMWNPEGGGPVDTMMRGPNPPERSLIRCVLVEDNAYLYRTELMTELRTDFIRKSAAKFRHIWRGDLDSNPELAIFPKIRRGFIDTTTLEPRFGLDWGYSGDPLVLIETYVKEPADPTTERGVIYIRDGVVDTHIAARDIPGEIDAVSPMARMFTITADSAEPKSIEDLTNAGFHVVGAAKGPGSIRAGITMIQGYDIVIHPQANPKIYDELTGYCWKQDKKTKRILRDPDGNTPDNVADALRYALEDYQPPAAGGGVDYV